MHLQVPPINPDVSSYYRQNSYKDILPHNHNSTITTMKLTLSHYYHLNLGMHSSLSIKGKSSKSYICPFTDKVKFDYLIKLFSARILYHVLQILNLLGGRYFENT